jgi:hypothetical protein
MHAIDGYGGWQGRDGRRLGRGGECAEAAQEARGGRPPTTGGELGQQGWTCRRREVEGVSLRVEHAPKRGRASLRGGKGRDGFPFWAVAKGERRR